MSQPIDLAPATELKHAVCYGYHAWLYEIKTVLGDIHVVQKEMPGSHALETQVFYDDKAKAEKAYAKIIKVLFR